MLNAISVDLEDWYHICGIENQQWANEWHKYSIRLERNVDKILNLLKSYNTRATFFTVGHIADKNPELIKKIAKSGHELASHGYFHRRIFNMSPEEFEKDLIKSKRAIESASGEKVLGYRAPEWSLKKKYQWALDILKKNGFEYDASANPLSHCAGKKFGLYPNQIETRYGRIYEFPLSTHRVAWERLPFSGGLPLRLHPYFYIINSTELINRAGFPAIFYIHPWEFDTERTKIDLPFNRKFMHYFNRKAVLPKIDLILQRFEFATIKEVLGLEQIKRPVQCRDKKKKKIDTIYRLSLSLTMMFYCLILAFLILCSRFVGIYSLALIVVVTTVWYLPWGGLFKLIEFFRKQ